MNIELQPTQIADLEELFIFQTDEQASYLAAFTAKNPFDKAAYMQKYTRLICDPGINNQTIRVNGVLAGSIAKFELEGKAEITYWIGKAFWGKGVATQALKIFLQTEPARPLLGRAAFDNIASQKVLMSAGFVQTGTDLGFANARQAEIEEFIYQLS